MCFFDPNVPAAYIGMELGNAGGPVEFIAMYGGLQFALGVYFLLSGLGTARIPEAVRIMAIIFAGLGVARLTGLLRVGIDDYNLWATVYELSSMTLAILAHRAATGRWIFQKHD